MKGIVFTEFMEMVEDTFGYELVDHIIEETKPASGGVYTAIGTYSHAEIVNLVVSLSKKTNTPVPVLLKAFGKHLFGVFIKTYNKFFEGSTNAFDFLESIETYIHVEVLKLYPDAELPKFTTEQFEDRLEMIYISDRKMADLAEGLIEATLEHFNTPMDIIRKNLIEDGSKVKFIIIRHQN